MCGSEQPYDYDRGTTTKAKVAASWFRITVTRSMQLAEAMVLLADSQLAARRGRVAARIILYVDTRSTQP